MTFTDSCIAKDCTGKAQRFYKGQVVALRAENCPQIDGAPDVVKACFYQKTMHDSGLAVLLENHSWAYCSGTEVAV